MMELFQTDGHLTDAGLRAIIDGGPDELQSLDTLARLEASEHLAFCDDCLLRYTALLEDDTLLAPEAPMKEPVMRRIRQRGRRILFSRYATVAAAAVLAVAMWMVGTVILPGARQAEDTDGPALVDTQPAPAAQADDGGFAGRISAAFGSVLDGVSGFFSGLAPQPAEPQQPAAEPPAPATPTPPTTVQRQQRQLEQERQEREKLFSQGQPDGFAADNGNAAA